MTTETTPAASTPLSPIDFPRLDALEVELQLARQVYDARLDDYRAADARAGDAGKAVARIENELRAIVNAGRSAKSARAATLAEVRALLEVYRRGMADARVDSDAVARLKRIDAHAGRKCEGDTAECGPVEYVDAEDVPLCAACWHLLCDETPLPMGAAS